VFGGMVAATVLTLLLVPVFYAVIENFRERRAQSAVAHATPSAEPAE
jgi:HAE1 family hydrophobic/amphiphilic exporter-1